jgi:hypothetical protein
MRLVVPAEGGLTRFAENSGNGGGSAGALFAHKHTAHNAMKIFRIISGSCPVPVFF